MTMSSLLRARVLGSVVVLLSFVAGVAVGVAVGRRPQPGFSVTMTATDVLPRELERLDLTDAQRSEIRAILARGRGRVLAVIRDFDPRMSAAVDSTDREIAVVLTETQRAALADYRKEHPPFVKQRIMRE